MSGPWERYAAAAPAGDGPWAKYGAAPAEPDRSAEIPPLHDTRQPPPKQDFLDKARETINGAPEAALSMLTATGGTLAGNAVGAVKSITSGKFGTPEGIAAGGQTAGEIARRATFQPRSEAGKETAERAGKLMEPLQGLPPHVALGPVGSAAGRAASGAEGIVRRTVAGAVDVDRAALARKAQSLGISIRPDMLSDNRFVRMIGEALDRVPLSGSQAEQRQAAFNRALGSQIGADPAAARITPTVFDAAMTKSGSTIGDIAKRTPVPFDQATAGKLADFVAETSRFETSDVGRIVTNYVDELKRAAQSNGGQIPGETFRKINTKLGAQIRRTEGDLKYVLSDLQEHMLDAMESRLTAADRGAWTEARRQYAIGKTIEPLVAKSKNGDVSPAGLMSAMTSDKTKKTMMARGRAGEMGDLARIGQMFLKEPESSGTAERLATYGAVVGGSWAEPHTAAGVYGGANLYNRLGPSASRWALGRNPEPLRPPMDEALTP